MRKCIRNKLRLKFSNYKVKNLEIVWLFAMRQAHWGSVLTGILSTTAW